MKLKIFMVFGFLLALAISIFNIGAATFVNKSIAGLPIAAGNQCEAESQAVCPTVWAPVYYLHTKIIMVILFTCIGYLIDKVMKK